MKVSIGRMSIEELDRLPEDGNRYELIDGELYVSAAPRNKHQLVSTAFLELMLPFVRKHELGRVYHAPFDVYLEPRKQTRVEPDIVFIARGRLDLIQDKGLYGAPDLVIEIISESTSHVDLFDKRDLYQRCGVTEYWIADPDERQVWLYRFQESSEPRELVMGDILTTPLLRGLEIQLSFLFAF